MWNTYLSTPPRRWVVAAAVSAAMTVATALILVPSGRAAVGDSVGILVVCNSPAWAEGTTYAAGARVTYSGRLYEARVAHTAHVGAGWNPVAAPSLWRDLGACDGGPPPTSAPPSSPPPSSPPPSSPP